jgi:hypothetical protein
LPIELSNDSIAFNRPAFGHTKIEAKDRQLSDLVFVLIDNSLEVHHLLQSAFRNKIEAANANSPSVGSAIAKPRIVTDITTVSAIVILIMFSNLLPFCVWYVNYGYQLEVYVIYPRFVIKLLFVDTSSD